jgi:60 kDa SS-A/Ro ribonucleoprotein
MTNNNGVKGFLGSKANTANQQKSQPTTNPQGGVAYTLTYEEELCNAFTLGLLRGTFYYTQEEMIIHTRDLFEKAINDNPVIATKYAIYAAETLGMKLMPVIWLVYLSALDDKKLFKRAFPRIIGKNIKLLYDFVELCRNSDIRPGGIHHQKVKGTNRGLGQGLKKIINELMYNELNDYNVTRFTGKLEDVCRLTRPEDKKVKRVNSKGEEYDLDLKKYFEYIFKPKNESRRLTFERAILLQETIDILQNKDRTAEEFQIALNNIKSQKLQMDEIKFTFGGLTTDDKKTVYTYFVPGMRYAALVSNLVAIERAFATSTRKVRKADPMGSGKTFEQLEVLQTNVPKELIDIVAKKLASFEDYKASKMLFFGLLTAHEMVITSEWKRALNETLKQAGKVAFADLPEGRTIRCSADTSGSMTTSVTNSLEAVDIASYLTAAVALSTGSQAYATASTTKTVALSNDNLVDCAVKIKGVDVGCGTQFETLLDGYKGEDVVIIMTDGMQSDSIERKWKNLTNKPNGAKLIVWHIVGYPYKVSNDPNIIILKGYSDTLLNTLANIITGKAGQMDIARNIKI